MKGEFLLGIFFRFTAIWRVARSNASLWGFFSASIEDLCRCHMSCVNCRLLCTRWFTPSKTMFHSFLELTWKWPVFSCLCIWRFMLVMFGNNSWAEHIWKVNFCCEPCSDLQVFGVLWSPMLPCEIFFSASMDDLCHCRTSCVNCRLLCTRLFTPS